MKKLIRKNLDELAQMMPKISETEQRAMLGGGYFDVSGNYTYYEHEYESMRWVSR